MSSVGDYLRLQQDQWTLSPPPLLQVSCKLLTMSTYLLLVLHGVQLFLGVLPI